MCSIFGIIGESKSAKESFDLLQHRGKDGSGYIATNHYFFGSHRLAIESFGKEHNQPLQKWGYTALFNGEIYNYKELIKKHNLDAKDEIETILELFLKMKEGFTNELRGMYAIAIFSQKSRELWLFRDLIGKKPLYFAQKDNKFIFASEPKAIQNEIGFRLNRRLIHQFLGYGTTPHIDTLSRDIYKLPPSSHLHLKNNSYQITTSDNLLEQPVRYETVQSASDAVEEALKEAVEIRVPKLNYGLLLSGGLDSSLVAALLKKIDNKKPNLFSIGYEGYQKYDERVFAKEVANHIDGNFYDYNFTKADFFETIDKLIDTIDEPLGDPAQIPLYFLIQQAQKEGAKVLFSGDGSDELFLGYRTYKEYLMMESVKELPYSNWLKNHLRSNFSLNKEWEWYKRALNKETIFRSTAEIYTDRQLNKLLRLQERDNKNFESIQGYWEHFQKSQRDIADWFTYCDIKVQLAEFYLSKIDRVSMLSSVEVRSPFIDKRVLQTTFQIDAKIRLNTQTPKPIIKQIATKYLPKTIINRKKKGLNYPFLEWILQEDAIKTINQANQKLNLFHQDHLTHLSQKAHQGKFRQHLFPLYILSKWLLKKGL